MTPERSQSTRNDPSLPFYSWLDTLVVALNRDSNREVVTRFGTTDGHSWYTLRERGFFGRKLAVVDIPDWCQDACPDESNQRRITCEAYHPKVHATIKQVSLLNGYRFFEE